MGKGVTLSKKHGLNPSMAVCPICGKAESVALLGHIKGDDKRYTIVSKDIFTQKVEGCAVLMKEADFNAVFNKH